jgi:agmatine/peptidylarginine deiminase
MNKNSKCSFKLIAEWEKPKAVALVYPGSFDKYKKKIVKDEDEFNEEDFFNDIKIKSISDDYTSIINQLTPLKEGSMWSDVYVITDGIDPAHIDTTSINNPEAIDYFSLPGISDIWIKDFAPIPARGPEVKTVYIKALYRPRYLPKREAIRLHKAGCKMAELFGREMIGFPLIWDIGNLTHDGNGTAIVTKRILKDNPELSTKEIRSMFRSVLGIDNLILINEEPGDITGHVDGTIRFLYPDTIVTAKYHSSLREGNDYIESIKITIQKQISHVIKFVDMPNGMLFDAETDGMESVFGNHVNFLKVSNTILVPVYNIPSDGTACMSLRNIGGNRIIPIKLNTIPHFGGSLHCMTWKVY